MGFGSATGGAIGSFMGDLIPIPGLNGQDIGRTVGGWFGFKKGSIILPGMRKDYKMLLTGGCVKKKKKKFQK